MTVSKIMWLIIAGLIYTVMVVTVATAATQQDQVIHLPPLPGDAVEILNITHDSDVGVCVGYIDDLGKPRMIQYGFRDVENYDIIGTFCFRERVSGWRPKLRTDNVMPPLPKNCKKVISVTNVCVGVVVGFVNDKNEYELIQYSYDNVFRYQFGKERKQAR